MDNRRRLPVRGGAEHLGTTGSTARKRTSDVGSGPAASRRRTRDPSPQAGHESDIEEYDPAQSMQQRRQIQQSLREMQKQMRENPDEFMQADPTALLDYLNQSDRIIKNVKQTAEAAIDSRGLVIAADLSARRVQRLTAGTVGNGIDVDEFVSKCITYMLQGRGIEDDEATGLSSTQRTRRRRPQNRAALGSDDEDDTGDDGDMMNWAHLGRFACIPAVRRPCLPGFLLGPLSIEKKARKTTKRSAPFRINNLVEVRPQELRAEDLKKSDKNDLPSICRKIHVQLEQAQQQAQDMVQREFDDLGDNCTPEQESALMERYALRSTGGIDLLRFVVNPHSFGQTVENMFYVSFLIRDGHVKLDFDVDGRPAIEPVLKNVPGVSSHPKATMRHQAIMSIDMVTWRDIIETFDIKQSMIPNREEEASQEGPGARGWYS
ncbi:Non-structural maintenance of chromosomes element 4 A [Staphylotrichum tortipilum]|uniref:Non-structural maintenance of chromosomes element 4 n=1 Tax=Staphylotrichum tortipilum TaxID=2831512 RepID=A0AAN6MT31_9PEZI|nr:Non-structural maintenance of chromosomes element 4 A [Staphylotrichum longicolle]